MMHIALNSTLLKMDIEAYVKKIGRFIENFRSSTNELVLTLKCSCDLYKTVWHITGQNHISDIGPATYLDGWGYFRVIAFDEANINSMFHDLQKLGPEELLSKKNIHQDAAPDNSMGRDILFRSNWQANRSIVKGVRLRILFNSKKNYH